MEAHFTCARFGETSLFGKVTPRAARYLDRRSSGMGMYRIDRSHLKMSRLHASEVPLDGSKVFIPGVERLLVGLVPWDVAFCHCFFRPPHRPAPASPDHEAGKDKELLQELHPPLRPFCDVRDGAGLYLAPPPGMIP